MAAWPTILHIIILITQNDLLYTWPYEVLHIVKPCRKLLKSSFSGEKNWYTESLLMVVYYKDQHWTTCLSDIVLPIANDSFYPISSAALRPWFAVTFSNHSWKEAISFLSLIPPIIWILKHLTVGGSALHWIQICLQQ